LSLGTAASPHKRMPLIVANHSVPHGVAGRHQPYSPKAFLSFPQQVHKGASAQSYGLAVARFARLPPEVIEAAAKRMGELEPSSTAGTAGAAAAAAGGGGGAAGGGDQAARDLLLKFAQLPLETGMAPDQLAVALQQHALELCQ